jgi:hypothetical protein
MAGFATAAQAAGPRLPCDSATVAYPAPGAPPAIEIWRAHDLAQNNWQPPPCTGWPAASHSKLVVTVTGSFHFDGGMEGLLAKIGAISSLKDIFYWSAPAKTWDHLASDASALSDVHENNRRKDFSPSDFGKGTELYYWEDGADTGATVYSLKVLENSAQRLVISSDNITTMRRFVFTLFKPGSLQSLLFLQQISPGTYGATIMTRTGEGASVLSNGHEETFINRADALFRQLAGIKTDQEPPAMR